jgi:hypothetical protein
MRTALAKTLSDQIDFKGLDAMITTKLGIKYLTRKVSDVAVLSSLTEKGDMPEVHHKEDDSGGIEHSGETMCRF